MAEEGEGGSRGAPAAEERGVEAEVPWRRRWRNLEADGKVQVWKVRVARVQPADRFEEANLLFTNLPHLFILLAGKSLEN